MKRILVALMIMALAFRLAAQTKGIDTNYTTRISSL